MEYISIPSPYTNVVSQHEIMQCIGASHLGNLPLTIPQAIRELAAALEGNGVMTLPTLAAIAGLPPKMRAIESQVGWWHELEQGRYCS